jgi:hypothetical protein
VHILRAIPLFVLSLPGLASADAPPVNSFVIHVETASHRADLQVHYFMTGIFGGVGGYNFTLVDDDGLLIPTEYEQKPAKTLRMVLYMPGCQVQLIRLDNLQAASREADFHCYHLATVRLRGKLDSSMIPFDQDPEVRVEYVAQWSHPFFGIMDGPVMTLGVGSTSITPDGFFVIDLPDFAADPISSNVGKDAYFMSTVRSRKSGNILAGLEADEPFRATPVGDLKIELEYPSPVAFFALPQQ